MNRRYLLTLPGLLTACALFMGCQAGPLELLFVRADNTSYRTPSMRSDEVLAIAARVDGTNSAEQQELVNDLARRIQAEQDPLVRESIVDSIAAFPMPLADQVLQAGLSDPDAGVRQHCCQALGARGTTSAVPVLAKAAADDESFDVRIAATRALGGVKSPEAVSALVAALEDNNPAMQYAGVEAMRSATGRDLGGDVRAYLAMAKGEAAPAVATKPADQKTGFLGRLSPF